MDFGVPRIISIVIIAVILIAGFIGLKKGLGRVLINLIKTVASFFVAFFFAKPVGAIIGGFGLKDLVFGKVSDFITNNGGEIANTVITEENYNTVLGEALTKIKIPEKLQSLIINFIKDKNLIQTDITANESISNALSTFACYAVAFIVLLIACIIVFAILKGIFKNIDKIPVIGTLDKLLGFSVNVIIALFIFSAIIWGFQLLQTSIPQLNDIANQAFALDQPDYKTLSKFMYEHNFILWVFNLLF